MSRKLAKHWISADEYERMGEAGIFHPDARLELIAGEIIEMSPIGSRHAACVDALTFMLGQLSQHRFIVRVQSPVRLDDFNEPQPDVALLRWRDDFYREGHPRPGDVLLVVEVADTTVETDRAVKLALYARAGIAEAWLVNLPDESVEVYSAPSGESYEKSARYARGEEARAETIAGLSAAVSALLG